MEIYIASFAGLLSLLLLSLVWVADRWEREPVELIQNSFLTGLAGQLAIVLVVDATAGPVVWSGPWILVTAALAALYLSVSLSHHHEMDEPFDGVVYSVSLMAGAVCVIHLHNLPTVALASPYHDAIASGSVPDLRDLLIFATWPGFSAELGQGCLLIVASVVAGAIIGSMQLNGRPLRRIVPAGLVSALAVTGVDLLTGGVWPVRAVLMVVAVGTAVVLKRGSPFRDRPEPLESDLVVAAVKTGLMVFGAALVAMVVLQSAAGESVIPDPAQGDFHPPAATTETPSP